MNPILAALQAYLEQLVSGFAVTAADFLVNWFKQHVLPKQQFQAMAPADRRVGARQWVKDMLNEFGQALVAKNILPSWLNGFVPLFEQAFDQALEKALEAAGL